MLPLRIAIVILAVASSALPYHLRGTGLFTAATVGFAIAAALAMVVLWQDEMLREVIVPKGLDLSTGVIAAGVLYVAIAGAWFYGIAPGLLHKCNLEGARFGRLDPYGFTRALEWVRSQVCRGYGHSLGVALPTRGLWIALVAALEEIAWRGGVQQFLAEKTDSTRGWVLASLLNGLACAATGNPMIALLGVVTGFVWGALYRYRGRLVPSIASHVVFSYFLFAARPLVDFS